MLALVDKKAMIGPRRSAGSECPSGQRPWRAAKYTAASGDK
jgi:hypothetical protein